MNNQIKIAIAQIDVRPGDLNNNLAKMLTYIDEARANNADLVVLPEMSDTGYDLPIVLKTAQKWEGGVDLALKQAAAKHGINIVAGISELTSEGVYNSTVFIDKKGNIGSVYRKTHLCTNDPPSEQKFLQPGNKLEIVSIENIQCGFMTCYEIRFPEVARTLAIKGAKIIIVTSAFPLSRVQHWETLLAARAIENQVFIVACNRVGTDAGMTFCGTSRIIDPYGTIISSGSAMQEQLIVGDIDLSLVESIRSQYKVHQDRRPELYVQS